jgi:hypothetical protein
VQDQVLASIDRFSAADRLGREELHGRARNSRSSGNRASASARAARGPGAGHGRAIR